MFRKISLAKISQFLFCTGIALLIIRNNSYYWPIKRASDILFLISFLCIIIYLTQTKSWQTYFSLMRPVLTGLFLVALGLIIGSAAGFLVFDRPFTTEALLTAGRFLEAGLLVCAIGFFQSHDEKFYRAAAIAQLSTLVYLFFLIVPSLAIVQYRFQIFENWPSNVGYYLIISLSLIFIFLFHHIKRCSKKLFFLIMLAAAYGALLLWTQARAAWVGFAVALIYLFSFKVFMSTEKIITFLKQIALIAVIFVSSFIILPYQIKNEVLVRIFPGARLFVEQRKNFADVKPYDLVTVIKEKSLQPSLYEPSRPHLWKSYATMLIRQPLGFGVNPPVITYEGGPRGPHNTPLEIMLHGGIIALIGFSYLVVLALKNAFCFSRSNGAIWALYPLVALVAIVAASLFDNLNTFRIMWILLGLGLFVSHRERRLDASQQ